MRYPRILMNTVASHVYQDHLFRSCWRICLLTLRITGRHGGRRPDCLSLLCFDNSKIYSGQVQNIVGSLCQLLHAFQLKVFIALLQFDFPLMFPLRQGSYKCSPCKPGFIGDGYLGCYPGDLCTTAQHTCQVNAQCSSTGPGRYKCTV